MKKRVAVVTHELTGGVGTMTRFVHRVLSESNDYIPEIILLATSASDSASMLLRDPATWRRGARIRRESHNGVDVIHAGAWAAEVELFRYQPRRELTELLSHYDILQFVAGTAPWVATAADVDRPKCLWIATTNESDRASREVSGSGARRAWSRAMRAVAERYERQGLALADSVLGLSPYTTQAVAAKMAPRSARVAPCGVDTDLFHPPIEDRRADGYILCVGRLNDARKNIAMLLRAYALLLQRVRELPDLWLVGGPLSPDLEKMISDLGLSERVILPGAQSGSELAATYRNASIFVLSSDEEGLGIVILEAMASGLPVVSTDSGGPSSIVDPGVTGYLTPVGEHAPLADAIQQLVESPGLRKQFGNAARSRAKEKFSIEKAGGIFLEQYERLL